MRETHRECYQRFTVRPSTGSGRTGVETSQGRINQLSLILPLLLLACAPTPPLKQEPTANGKHIAFARDKGNCLACHEIEDGEFPGNIGPPLKNLPLRFKTKRDLRAQIWDATQFNPDTSMPPFGKNKILTAEEINQVVDYLWEL